MLPPAALGVFLFLSFVPPPLPSSAPALSPSSSPLRLDPRPALSTPSASGALATAADAIDRDRRQETAQDRPAAPGPALTFDLRSVPSAPEYRTEPPDGPAFLGSDAAALDRSLARINKTRGISLRPDHRLALLSRWIYEHLGPDHAPPPQSVVDVLARRLGLPESLPHLLVVDAQNVPRIADAVSGRLAQVFHLQNYTHIGGVAETAPESRSTVVVLALSRRHIHLGPIPRLLIKPAQIKLGGLVDGEFSKPELAHTLPSGETRVTDLGPGTSIGASVRLSGIGRHRLEIIAQGPEGPEVLANIPVFVGVPVDDTVVAVAGPSEAVLTPGAVRDRLFELVNAERTRAGLARLAPDPELDAVALRHSEDMRAHDFVAHVSPTNGNTEQRLKKAGITTAEAAENVGKGYSPDEIHRGFMDSPGHRAAILLQDVTHLGVGVVTKTEYGRTSFLVTELFIRRIPPLGPDARAVFLKELNRERASSGARPVREDPPLSVIADKAARELLAEPSLGQNEMLTRLADHLRSYPGERSRSTLYSIICVVESLEEGAKQADADPKTGRFDRLGFGLAQGSRPGLIPNSIVLVLIFFSE